MLIQSQIPEPQAPWPAPKVVKNKLNWPPEYLPVWGWRQGQLRKLRASPELLIGAKAYYAEHPVEFIIHWMDTYDPRNAGKPGKHARMPFVLFQRQAEFIEFIMALLEGDVGGLVEKARDMGATWLCCAVSVWLWLFKPGIAIGWGSRKEMLVDKLGDPDSIFEKIRMLIRYLPKEFMPEGFNERDHMAYMRIVNPETDATITGEAGNKIGRGGRKRIYFKDESAHYEQAESIEAALGDNTNCPVDISSVQGLGNVFHRRREAGVEWEGGPATPDKTNVFIMDWSDHPAKDQAWYDKRRARAEEEGLLHLFAQEVDRDYSAAIEGIIIPKKYIDAAVDAHIKLGFPALGKCISGLDVADEGGDKNALAIRVGSVLTFCKNWAQGDTGETANRALEFLMLRPEVELQYDSVGIGAGVKAEYNRLTREGLMPEGVAFVPWSAGSGVQFPDAHIMLDEEGNPDLKSPTNKDFYDNLKAQAWWELRLRFERTYRAVVEGIYYPPDELISLSSTLPQLATIRKELNQATAGLSRKSLKMVVNKAPEGTRSPNLADSIVMAFWPIIDEAAIARMFLRSKRQ